MEEELELEPSTGPAVLLVVDSCPCWAWNCATMWSSSSVTGSEGLHTEGLRRAPLGTFARLKMARNDFRADIPELAFGAGV